MDKFPEQRKTIEHLFKDFWALESLDEDSEIRKVFEDAILHPNKYVLKP